MLFNNESAVLNEEFTSEISQYELGATGGLMHAYEIECAFNEMMESIGVDELKFYMEAGGDKPYKMADFAKDPNKNQGILDKVGAFIRMIIQKVQELFNRAVAAIGKLQANSFIEKYGKRIKELVSGNSKNEFKPFKMQCKINTTNLGVARAAQDTVDAMEKEGKLVDPDSFRGHMVGKATCSAKDFPAAYKEKLYGKGVTVKDIGVQLVAASYDNIKDYKKTIDGINKARVKAVNAFKKTSEKFKKKIAAAAKSSDTEGQLKANEFSYMKDMYSITLQCLSMDLRLEYDTLQYDKAVCLKALSSATAKKEEPAKKEAPKQEAAGPEVSGNAHIAELFSQVEIL